eukprot:SAG31_NODE_23496_length_503_cov_0.886139_1_plen_20_part_01
MNFVMYKEREGGGGGGEGRR